MWVCGPERVLVEQVVAGTRAAAVAAGESYERRWAGELTDEQLWLACRPLPTAPATRRLFVIRDAERIRHFDVGLLRLRSSATRLLLVSGEAELSECPGAVLAGLAVCCDRPRAPQLLAWAARRSGGALDAGTAAHLLDRVGGRLEEAADVADKLALFVGPANHRVIEALCEPAPVRSFADALVDGQPAAALLAAGELGPGDYPAVVGELAAALDALAVLGPVVRAGTAAKDLSRATDLGWRLVRRLVPLAPAYLPDTIARRRELLAVIDRAVTRGAGEGLAEALVALW